MEKVIGQGKELLREDRLLFVCLIFYCVLFAGFFFLKTGIHRNIFYASLPFSLVALIKYRYDLKSIFLENRIAICLAGVFLLYLCLSLLWSDVNEQGREFEKTKILLFLPLSLATLHLLVKRIAFSYDWLVSSFIAAATLTGLYLLGDYVLNRWGGRLEGLGRAENSVLAGYLYSIAFMGVMYSKVFANMAWKYKAAILTLLIVVMLCTLSRGPLLALGITFWILLMVKGHYKIGLGMILIGLCGLLVIFSTSLKKHIPIVNRTDTGRTQVWIQAIDRIGEKPVFGYGIGSKFYYEFKKPMNKGYETVSHPHNLYLSVWIQGGIVGLALLLAVMSSYIARAYRFAKGNQEFWPLAVLTSCAIMGFYDFGGPYVNLGVLWAAFWYQYPLMANLKPKTT